MKKYKNSGKDSRLNKELHEKIIKTKNSES